jgi:hypothetical protein
MSAGGAASMFPAGAAASTSPAVVAASTLADVTASAGGVGAVDGAARTDLEQPLVSEDDHSTRPPPVLDEGDVEAERFFAQGEGTDPEVETLAPTAMDEEEEWALPVRPPLTPEQLLRRARLRRMVALGLGGGVALLVSGIGAARLAGASRTHAQPAPARAAAFPSAPIPDSEPKAKPRPTPIPMPVPSAETPSPSAQLANAAAAPALVKKARSLLQSGHAREGVALAREAIATDSTLAEGYVLLAAGLEDLGRWSDAHRTFALCTERTQSSECSYFARKPR